MNEDFQSKYNAIEREIRDLKTQHEMKSTMRTYTKTWTFAQTSDFQPTTLRLTFAESDQPILTQVFGTDERVFIALEPSGNTQDIVIAYTTGSYVGGYDMTFLTNREILSITTV